MFRLNINITEEAEAVIRSEAKRYGATMGAIITIWALEKKKEQQVLAMTELYNQLPEQKK